MSSSDPEDDICVMELIKRRKAVSSTKSESSKLKSQNSNNNSVKEKKVNGKSNGQSKAKESETKKWKRKDSEDEEEESESEESDSSSSEYESDDDDDKPIGQLVKKRKQENNKELKNKSKTKDEKKAKSSSSSSLSKKSTEFYNDTGKGMLVQRLLVRWWYVIEWPKPEEIGSPPPGYEALDGFPGVFICTRSDELGKIVDLRNKENCPSLKNLSKWTSSRLKETCIQAYEKQMEVLQKLGEEESETYHNLKQELREIKAVSPDKADKEALKYTF